MWPLHLFTVCSIFFLLHYETANEKGRSLHYFVQFNQSLTRVTEKPEAAVTYELESHEYMGSFK
jgi:hypothetical protein